MTTATASSTTTTWVGSATDAFHAALTDIVGSRSPDGDPRDAGRRAALDAIAGATWTDHVGPFFDTDGVCTLLGGVSRQAVHDRTRRHRLLALRTASGRVVYPTFQFTGRTVLPGLADVLKIIAPDDDEAWLVASWLRTTDTALGSSPAEALASGRTTDVMSAARGVATALRG